MHTQNIVADRRLRDSLTGLWSRGYILPFIENLLAQPGTQCTIFIIDLNKFKTINDIQGHHVGDVVLQTIGARLASMENGELVFARLGGDEFIAVYMQTENTKIDETARNIYKEIKYPIKYERFEYEMNSSIGMARYPLDADNTEDLLKLADSSMYYAKRNNLSNHFLITQTISKELKEKHGLRSLLKSLDVDKELSLCFQPFFCATTQEIHGVEAIPRWNTAEGKTIEKEVFCPIAEELGNIQFITKWTFFNSISKIYEINKKFYSDIAIHISISQSCIYHKIFFSNMEYMLNAISIKPHWLGISLNEKSLMYMPSYIKKLLHSIHKLGIKICIQDFGADAICIGEIKNLHIDYFRIAPQIIQNIERDKDMRATLHGIIMMAKSMDIQTIAKGVNSTRQFEILQDLGCDLIQGEYLAAIQSQHGVEKHLLPSRTGATVFQA